MQHHGYQSSIPNNYQQYYAHPNWNTQQLESGHARMGSQVPTNAVETPYTGNNQGTNGPTPHDGQWQHTSSNFGQTVDTWNSPNWNYREWQRRDNLSFPSEYPSHLAQNHPFHSINTEGSAQRPSDSEMIQRGNGTNYQRTLQYVQQCQESWNSGVDKNSHAN
jgi:hypothetical protein